MSWESIKTVDKFIVKIPERLELVCDFLAHKMKTEFAVLTNIKKIEGNIVYLEEEFYIPVQKVNGSFVKIDPDAEDETEVKKYNTVIHRHPDDAHFFSNTDDEFINKNFKCSILYTEPAKFVLGIFNLPLSKRVHFRSDIEIEMITKDQMNEDSDYIYDNREFLEKEIEDKITKLSNNEIEETEFESTNSDFYRGAYDYKCPELDFSKNDEDEETALELIKEKIRVEDQLNRFYNKKENKSELSILINKIESLETTLETLETTVEDLEDKIETLEKVSSVDEYVLVKTTVENLEVDLQELELKLEEYKSAT